FHLANDGFHIDLAAGVDGLAPLGAQLAGHALLGGGRDRNAAPGRSGDGLVVLGAAGGDEPVDGSLGEPGGVALGPVAGVGDHLAGWAATVADDVVEDGQEVPDV